MCIFHMDRKGIHTHTHIRMCIYIHEYVCVCVCVSVEHETGYEMYHALYMQSNKIHKFFYD